MPTPQATMKAIHQNRTQNRTQMAALLSHLVMRRTPRHHRGPCQCHQGCKRCSCSQDLRDGSRVCSPVWLVSKHLLTGLRSGSADSCSHWGSEPQPLFTIVGPRKPAGNNFQPDGWQPMPPSQAALGQKINLGGFLANQWKDTKVEQVAEETKVMRPP